MKIFVFLNTWMVLTDFGCRRLKHTDEIYKEYKYVFPFTIKLFKITSEKLKICHDMMIITKAHLVLQLN